MAKLSNFFALFKRNSLSVDNRTDDKSTVQANAKTERVLHDNNHTINQVEENEKLNTTEILSENNYFSSNISNNESDFLKLFKYNSIADSSKTFNIETALNNNWDKVDTFATNVSQEMEDKADEQWRSINWRTENDLPSTYANNSITYFMTTSAWDNGNIPNSTVIKTIKYSNMIIKQETFRSDGYPLLFRMVDTGDGSWGAWREIATTDKISTLSLPFASGVTDLTDFGQRTFYQKNSLENVHIQCSCKFTNTVKINQSNGFIIATMPVGYRPTNMASGTGCVALNENYEATQSTPVGVSCMNNGTLTIYGLDYIGTNNVLNFSLSYPTT